MRRTRQEMHDRQLADLKAVLEYTLRDNEQEAFEAMYLYLKNAAPTALLSEKQVDWLQHTLEKHQPTYLNLFSSGKVPVGNPDDVVVNVGPKVLKPPGRRTG